MTPREVLLAAADYLEANGWQQGSAGEDGGPRCALGAMLSVLPRQTGKMTQRFVRERNSALRRARRMLCEPRVLIGTWNDAPGRTRDEVVRALREAAR